MRKPLSSCPSKSNYGRNLVLRSLLAVATIGVLRMLLSFCANNHTRAFDEILFSEKRQDSFQSVQHITKTKIFF